MSTQPCPDKGAEAERDMLDEYKAWLEKRGPLGVGASPERIFFAGYSAARRTQPAAVGAEGLPPLPRYKLVPGEHREWMAPAEDGAWCRWDHVQAFIAADRKAQAGAVQQPAEKGEN